jgi:Zn-dependent M28 family amino/carboxypeptidase
MRGLPLLLVALLVSCSPAAPEKPLMLAEMPDVNADAMLADIRVLASDEFSGREPATKGEELTLAYLTKRFQEVGAEPGNPDGTWVQRVPLVSVTPTGTTPLVVTKGATSRTFKLRDEVVAFSPRMVDRVELERSEIVFAGYGVQAPEYDWDDFRGADVKGKTLVVLVNDPPVPEAANPDVLDPKFFGGRAMTYYGRWTYKYAKAAELGAAAVFIVHETIPAGYPFSVVQGFGEGSVDLGAPDKNAAKPAFQGWLSVEAATRLLAMAGQDYQKLKALARTREFRAVPLGMTATMSTRQTTGSITTANVVAKITGSDPALRDEALLYVAHWDHLGLGEPVDGDRIYNGARDNASGTAMLVSLAEAFRRVQPPPKRTIVFLAVTAEESGLLGSEYYARHPLYPLARTLAAINIDQANVWGRTTDLTVVGLGASDLDTYAREAAAEQRRTIKPEAEPEKGFYYRSDHFSFARAGVPAFFSEPGETFVGRPASYGREVREEWTNRDYHQPSDEVKDSWDLSGAAEDAKLLFAMGYRIANAAKYPEWAPGNEFRSIREKKP